MKSTAEMVQEALETAEKAQTTVTEALKQASSDIKGTQDLLVSVSQDCLIQTALCLIYKVAN